jgi:hypothetical protein
MSNNLRELKPHPGFTPIPESDEPHANTLAFNKQPLKPAVADKAPVAISQGAVRAGVGNLPAVPEE